MSAISAAILTISALAMPASATERCDIRYSVRLILPGDTVGTGTAVRAFSTCVSSLTKCHTDAEELAREHARRTSDPLAVKADLDSINIIDIESSDDCEEP
jgi:hypothetical protein